VLGRATAWRACRKSFVLPAPCKPGHQITAGGVVVRSERVIVLTISRVSSRCTTGDEGLAGIQVADNFMAHCGQFDWRRQTLLQRGSATSGFEQGHPHFAQRILNIALGESGLSAQVFLMTPE